MREMSPRFLARMAFVLGLLEGMASVWGGLRICGRLVVSTDAAAMEFEAVLGYATYLWPPLVNAGRWRELARATRELESGRA